MADNVPLLDGPSSPPTRSVSNIRARITGPSNSSNAEESGIYRRQGSSLNDEGRCCKKIPPNRAGKAKYSITFIASTWGFLTSIERSIILPTMWLYFKTYWGDETASKFYGVTLAVFGLSILFATPLFGYAGHSRVNVKFLLLLANLLEIIGNIAYLVAGSPWVVFAGRLIAGLGASCEPPMYADLTRSTEFNERTPFIIVLLLTRQVGLIFGPAFTLILAKLDVRVLNMKISVYNGPGLVMACLWVIHSVLILFFYPNLDRSVVRLDDRDKSPSTSGNLASDPEAERLISRPEVRFGGFRQFIFFTLYATTFASYYSVMALESVLSPLANRAFNWGAVEVSYIYIGASVLIIFVSGIMHFMSKCIEDRKLIVLGLGFLVLSYAYLTTVIYTLDSLGDWGSSLVVVGVAIHVIGMPFPLAISESLYTKLVPAPLLDQAQTILRTVINVAFLIGPYVGGSLQAHPFAVFMSMMGLNLIPLFMFLIRFSDFRVTAEMQLENAGFAVDHLNV